MPKAAELQVIQRESAPRSKRPSLGNPPEPFPKALADRTFTQEDPIGLAGGLNVYGFARGDPVNLSDAFGLCADGGGDASGQAGGGADTTRTQCERMADMAGRIASGVDSHQEFAAAFGQQAGGVTELLPLLQGGGGTNNPALLGGSSGFRAEFDDGSGTQARHFAVALFTADRTTNGLQRWMMNFVREKIMPSGNDQDYALTKAAYSMYAQLRSGTLKLGDVKAYVSKNVCSPAGQ